MQSAQPGEQGAGICAHWPAACKPTPPALSYSLLVLCAGEAGQAAPAPPALLFPPQLHPPSWVYRPANLAPLPLAAGLLGARPALLLAPPHAAWPLPVQRPPAAHPVCQFPPSAQATSAGAPLGTPSRAAAPPAGTATGSSTVAALQPPPASQTLHPASSPATTTPPRAAAKQEMVLPSAEEPQLHATISRLRVALDAKEAEAATMQQQLEGLQRELAACDAERRGLQLQLLEGRHAALPPGAGGPATPPGDLLAQLRQELGREAQAAAEARAERDALRLEVAALRGQAEAASQAGAQVSPARMPCLHPLVPPLQDWRG